MRYDVSSWAEIEDILPELDEQDRLHLKFAGQVVRVRVEDAHYEEPEV